MEHIIFQKEPIRVKEFLDQVGSDEDGSMLFFVGQVRKRSRGRDVTHLEYELYETMARKEIAAILAVCEERWQPLRCLVVHRYGRVEIGEASVLVAVASPHRDSSFNACRFIIDELKAKVPIWKKEFYTGGEAWIGQGS